MLWFHSWIYLQHQRFLLALLLDICKMMTTSQNCLEIRTKIMERNKSEKIYKTILNSTAENNFKVLKKRAVALDINMSVRVEWI